MNQTMDASDDLRLRELMPRLRRFARSLCGNAAAADDLVQSALERAIRHWDARRDDAALESWLFAILYRRFVDEHRRQRRWRQALQLLGAPGRDDAAPSAERVHEGRAALAAFAALPEADRALLMLVSVEGFAYREAADVLGLPIGTVMSRLSRARARLRSLCDPGTAPASVVSLSRARHDRTRTSR